MGVPERMRRPSAAREALGLSPVVQAGWTDASCIESIPFESASAEPVIFFAGRPAAEWAANARAGRAEVFFLVEFAIQKQQTSHARWRTCPAIMAEVGCTKSCPTAAVEASSLFVLYAPERQVGVGCFRSSEGFSQAVPRALARSAEEIEWEQCGSGGSSLPHLRRW
jgi:hypothetical protein